MVNTIIKKNIYYKLNELVEELSSEEFIQKVGDDVHTTTGVEMSDEQVKEEVGKILLPLLEKVSDVGLLLVKL